MLQVTFVPRKHLWKIWLYASMQKQHARKLPMLSQWWVVVTPHKVPNSDSICYWDGNIGNPPMKQVLMIFRLLCNLQAGWSIEIWRQQSALKYLRPHHTEIAILMKYDSTTGRCFVLNRAAPKPVASHDFPIKIYDIFKCLFHVSL